MHFGSSQIVLNLLIFGHLMKIGGLYLNGSGLNIRMSVVCINLFESCPLCDVLGSGGGGDLIKRATWGLELGFRIPSLYFLTVLRAKSLFSCAFLLISEEFT